MEKNETPKNLALLTADEVTLSILEVDAEGVRIKLWPDARRAGGLQCAALRLWAVSVLRRGPGRHHKGRPLPHHLPREQRCAHQ